MVSPSPPDSISGRDAVNAVNPFVAFYDIHGRKREVLFFCSFPDPTRDVCINIPKLNKL
jgi:hypothetical protein